MTVLLNPIISYTFGLVPTITSVDFTPPWVAWVVDSQGTEVFCNHTTFFRRIFLILLFI